MHQPVHDYEPADQHTYDSFKQRQEARARRAAFERANTFEGSVIERGYVEVRPALALPAPDVIEGYLEGCKDCYDEAQGG